MVPALCALTLAALIALKGLARIHRQQNNAPGTPLQPAGGRS